MLSDSDVEDEAAEVSNAPINPSLHLTTTTSRGASDPPARRQSTSGDMQPIVPEQEMRGGGEEEAIMEDATAGGEGHADEAMEEDAPEEVQGKRVEVTPTHQLSGPVSGPKKTRVMVRDAAWSTWWAVLYWVSHFILKLFDLTIAALHRHDLLRTSLLVIRPLALTPNPLQTRLHHLIPTTRTQNPTRMDSGMDGRTFYR